LAHHDRYRGPDRLAPAGLTEAAACALVSYAPWRLLESLDDIGLTLRHEDEIADFEQRRGEHLLSVTGSGSS
jgi:hypothetical protein